MYTLILKVKFICVYVCVYTYICMYIYRERKRLSKIGTIFSHFSIQNMTPACEINEGFDKGNQDTFSFFNRTSEITNKRHRRENL